MRPFNYNFPWCTLSALWNIRSKNSLDALSLSLHSLILCVFATHWPRIRTQVSTSYKLVAIILNQWPYSLNIFNAFLFQSKLKKSTTNTCIQLYIIYIAPTLIHSLKYYIFKTFQNSYQLVLHYCSNRSKHSIICKLKSTGSNVQLRKKIKIRRGRNRRQSIITPRYCVYYAFPRRHVRSVLNLLRDFNLAIYREI